MRPVRVYRADNAADAHMMRDYLERSGVPVELRGVALSSLAGVIPVRDSQPTLWVRSEDAARARALVEQHLNAPVEDGPPWTCRGCGETVDAHFLRCWNCERPRIV